MGRCEPTLIPLYNLSYATSACRRWPLFPPKRTMTPLWIPIWTKLPALRQGYRATVQPLGSDVFQDESFAALAAR